MARQLDGASVLFSGNGSGGFLKNPRVIGVGWSSYTSVFSPGDFDGDGKSDVIARSSAGLLYLYPGNGTGGWFPRRLIGSGWNVYSTLMSSGNLSGDGRSDILGRGLDGRLWLSRGDGTGGLPPRQLVGSGWNIFSTVLS